MVKTRELWAVNLGMVPYDEALAYIQAQQPQSPDEIEKGQAIGRSRVKFTNILDMLTEMSSRLRTLKSITRSEPWGISLRIPLGYEHENICSHSKWEIPYFFLFQTTKFMEE